MHDTGSILDPFLMCHLVSLESPPPQCDFDDTVANLPYNVTFYLNGPLNHLWTAY